jgi:flavodoxin
MKKILMLVLAIFCAGGITGFNTQADSAQSGNDGKILVAFFTWSGNNKVIAEQIAKDLGCDIFQIKTATPYPETWNECIALARQEQDNDARPVLSGSVSNMEQYGTIILCYPNWWGTLPMALFTFFETYDFSGKTIYPLITHGGSGFGSSLEDMKKACPKTVIGEGFSILAYDRDFADGPMVKARDSGVTSWLRKIGVAK